MTTVVLTIDDLCEQLQDLKAEKQENGETPVVVVGGTAGQIDLISPSESEYDVLQAGDAGFEPDTFANPEGIAPLKAADPSMLHTLVVDKSSLSAEAKAELANSENPDDEDGSDDDSTLVCDGGIVISDLIAFERDLLFAVRALERDGDPPHGLAIKDQLEAEYGEAINHSRLYQNLDGLMDDGLLTKGKKDDRTNEYATTDEARELLARRAQYRAQQVGLSTNGGEAE